MTRRFDIAWVWRSAEPAQSPPDENFPYGMALDFTKGEAKACLVKLPYPAAGVGTWVVTCGRCGFSAAVTAAGRADDPTQVKLPCKTADA